MPGGRRRLDGEVRRVHSARQRGRRGSRKGSGFDGQRLRRRQSRNAQTRSAVPQHGGIRPKRVDLALAPARHRPSLPGGPAQPDRRLHQPRRGLDSLRQRASVRRAGGPRDRRLARLVDRPSHRRGPRLASCRRAAAGGPRMAGRVRSDGPGGRRRGDDRSRSGAQPRGGRPPRRSRPPLVLRLHRRRPRRRGARRATRSPACPISSRRRWPSSTTSSRPMSPRACARSRRPAGA